MADYSPNLDKYGLRRPFRANNKTTWKFYANKFTSFGKTLLLDNTPTIYCGGLRWHASFEKGMFCQLTARLKFLLRVHAEKDVLFSISTQINVCFFCSNETRITLKTQSEENSGRG